MWSVRLITRSDDGYVKARRNKQENRSTAFADSLSTSRQSLEQAAADADQRRSLFDGDLEIAAHSH